MNWPTKCRLLWRYFPIIARVLALPIIFIVVPVAQGQTGSVSASLNPCVIAGGGSTCTSRISWTSSGVSAVQVWVADEGGTEVLFAVYGSGAYFQDATWILPAPHSYVFTLYDYSSGTRGATLGSKTVTGQYSITLTWGNTTNSAITPDLLVGDSWTLSISGAPASAAIVWAFILNPPGSWQYYTLASTDSSGNYTTSAAETSGSIGTYRGQWQVGGQNVSNEYDFEVVRRPNYLDVNNPTASNCPNPSYPYGVAGSIPYRVWDANDYLVVSSDIVMYPYFNWNSGGLQQVTSALGGLSSGTFTYSPLYDCQAAAFGADAFGSEILEIRIGASGVYETVRSQSWTAWGYAPNSGRLTNGSDVNIIQ